MRCDSRNHGSGGGWGDNDDDSDDNDSDDGVDDDDGTKSNAAMGSVVTSSPSPQYLPGTIADNDTLRNIAYSMLCFFFLCHSLLAVCVSLSISFFLSDLLTVFCEGRKETSWINEISCLSFPFFCLLSRSLSLSLVFA